MGRNGTVQTQSNIINTEDGRHAGISGRAEGEEEALARIRRQINGGVTPRVQRAGRRQGQQHRLFSRLLLPVAGLMSNKPISEVRRKLDEVIGAARSLGSELHDPFMTLGFLALEVIPHLKLTDQGGWTWINSGLCRFGLSKDGGAQRENRWAPPLPETIRFQRSRRDLTVGAAAPLARTP